MTLREAIKHDDSDLTDADITNIINNMIELVELGEDPEEVLLNEGYECDYIMDLLEEMR